MNKKCTWCKKILPYVYFRVNRATKDGMTHSCKNCLSMRQKNNYDPAKRYIAHLKSEKKISLDPKRLEKRKLRVNNYNKKYYNDNKKLINKNNWKYIKSDAKILRNHKLRHRIYDVLKRGYKNSIVEKDLGCTVSYFRKYLEKKWHGNMSWDNYGSVWVVDHIIPLKVAINKDNGIYKCLAHYINTQPLLSRENMVKGATYG